MNYLMTRRSFLQRLATVAAAAGFSIPAFDQRRSPYVLQGEVVDYIGHCPGGFIGGQVVDSVGKWDGVGYPVVTRNDCYGSPAEFETYYDVDLCNFNRELPDEFWGIGNAGNQPTEYPNVHTYVRMQRYGESMTQAITHLNFAGIRVEDYV